MTGSREDLDALRQDKELAARVLNFHYKLCAAGFWGYMQREAAKTGRFFALPDTVRNNLNHVPEPISWKRDCPEDFPII